MAVVLSNIINIFATPTEVFQNIKTAPKWLVAFLVVVIISMVCGYFLFPFSQKAMEETMLSKMSDKQVQQTISTMNKFQFVGLLAVPIPIVIKWFLYAGLLYFGAILFGSKPNSFKSVFVTLVHVELILVLMAVINILILYAKGVESVSNLTDLQAIIGLDFLMSDKSQNAPLFTLLNSFNVFSIWYVVVLSIGMHVVAQLEKWKATILVTSVWLLGVGVQFAFSLLSANMQGMVGK